jgi:molecular chaperone GrpE
VTQDNNNQQEEKGSRSQNPENEDQGTSAEGIEGGGSTEEQDLPALQEALNTARTEAEKNWDMYLRERAEQENFRKRMQREKEDLARFANENLLRAFLPILDNLERAVSHASQDNRETAAGLLEGVEMTVGQFHKVLEKSGVTPVEAIGRPFDPAWHEAMGQLESNEYPPNTVMQELQKGYALNDRLLRPALVMVTKTPSQN